MRRTLVIAAMLAGFIPASAFAGLTVTVDKSTGTQIGSQMDQFEIWGLLTFDSSYATGGEALAASDLTSALATNYPNATCTTLERLFVGNGEISDVPYMISWDDAAGKVMVFQRATVATENTAGVASTPTALTVVSDEQCTVAGTTCTLANTPISILGLGIIGGTSDGKPGFVQGNIAPDAAQEIGISGATVTINSGDATTLNVTYAHVSTAGVASVPTTLTAGANATEATNGSNLAALAVEFNAVCSF